jgi:hypothetical protein
MVEELRGTISKGISNLKKKNAFERRLSQQ